MREVRGNLRSVPAGAAANSPDDLDAALQRDARVAFIRGMRRKGWTIDHAMRECAADRKTVCRWISGESRVPGKALVAVGAVVVANDNAREAA